MQPDETKPKYATDLKTLKAETEVETRRSGKPGGQRRDKTETAVRLRHIPSGVTAVASDYRSQAKNRELAFQRLQERLERLNKPRKPRIRRGPSAGALARRKEEKIKHSDKKQLRQLPDISE
ncbi:unnamed protein product [marine sediment metagenome]|uniref:Prokaryotic-type class I peptide chain release factors domain-containing protein n=1 Tax=marine sediment metagenome TaxID=412755 RepID=X1J5D8_9ZZZZ